jgi:2-methylcitrate dehydratase PrpD
LKLFSRGPGTDGEEWLGRRLAVDDPGVLPKRYPSCGSTHLVLDGIDDLRQQHGFTADDVVRVHATVGRAGLGSLPYRDPADGVQAKFSMDYCVRRFLLRGTLTLDDFTDRAVAEDRSDHTAEVELDAWADGELNLGVGQQPPHRVRMVLRDGTVLERLRELPKGSVREPFDEGTRRAKFLDCVGAGSGDLYDELMLPGAALPPGAVRAVLRRARRVQPAE